MAAPRRPRPHAFVIGEIRHFLLPTRDRCDAHDLSFRRPFRPFGQVATQTIVVRAMDPRHYTRGRQRNSSVGGLEALGPFLRVAVVDANGRYLAPMGSSIHLGRFWTRRSLCLGALFRVVFEETRRYRNNRHTREILAEIVAEGKTEILTKISAEILAETMAEILAKIRAKILTEVLTQSVTEIVVEIWTEVDTEILTEALLKILTEIRA